LASVAILKTVITFVGLDPHGHMLL